jgi:hypothetical protein
MSPNKTSTWLAAAILCVGGFGFIGVHPASAAVACSAAAAAQNGISVSPSHGQAFYIDTGVTPRIDAGYVGYRVTNATGSTQTSLWTTVTDFTGGVVSLVNPLDSEMRLPTLANNATGVSYFMLKASAATTASQKHTVRVYDRRPDLAGATKLYECDYTFSRVKETIKAAANKLEDTGYGTTAAIEVSDTTPELGQTVSVTAEGATGTIGAGSTPDLDIVWLSPAAYSTWPTRALRLESVSVTFDANKNFSNTNDETTYTNQLLISGATSASNVQTSAYRATYTFRVIGQPSSTVKVFPLAQISSGTQVKHTDQSGAIDVTFGALAVNAALTKGVTATSGLTVITCGSSCTVPGGLSGMTYVAVPYRLTGTSTTATTLNIDEFVDKPENGLIFKPGSAKITDIGRTNVTIADPIYFASEASLSPRPVHFAGPFQMNSTTSAVLDYTMYVPVGSYANVAYATVGDLTVGANAAAMSRVTVTSTGTSSVGVTVDTVGSGVVTTTDAATGITTSAATLNGTVDPNGATPLTGQFEYGTSASLIGATTVTATTPSSGDLSSLVNPTAISVNLTGLSSNTTYYYRAMAGTVVGQILSFTTNAVVASPTVTTTAVSGVSTTAATLNGSVNPNMTPVTAVQFIYGTSSSLSSGTTTLTQWDSDLNLAMTAAGSSVQLFSQALTGLTSGTTYYYKIRACTGTLSGTTSTTTTCSVFIDGSILNFKAALPPTVTTNAATSVTISAATLNGSVNANNQTTATAFEYGTVTDLSYGSATLAGSPSSVTGTSATAVSAGLTGLSGSTTYYFRAIGTSAAGPSYGSILSFTTSSLTARTLTIDSGSYLSTYVATMAGPTITSTPSAGSGAKTYTSSTLSVCTVGASTGAVTFVSAGTCTIGASIATDGTYAAATASAVSFTITAAARSLVIDAVSYGSSYTFTATPPTITSTPSAGGGTKTYSSSTTGVCTVGATTGVVTFVSLGTCTIGANITASGLYAAADATAVSFGVTAGVRTLTIDSGSYSSTYAFTAAPPTITSTASVANTSGTKSYSSSTTGVCTVNASTGAVTFVSAGTCTIGASITAGGNYGAADSATISFAITLATRTLAIDETYASTYTTTATPPTITSTPSAGSGTKTYSSSTTGVCTIGASTGAVTFVSAGTCTIGASIASDGSYATATATAVSFSVTLTPATLAINGSSYNSSYTLAETAPTITSTASAGSGAKTYSSSTTSICTVNATTGAVTFTGATGTCTIGAHLASDGIYTSADATTVSFSVGLAARTFAINGSSYTASYYLTDAAPTITSAPSAGSGTKSYSSSTTGVCTVNASTGAVTFVSAGTCTIGAHIATDGTYAAADASTVSFTLSLAPRTLTIDTATLAGSYALTATPPTITSTPNAGSGTKSYSSSTTGVCNVDDVTGAVTFTGATGTCTIGASIATDGTYAAATATSVSFNVTLATRSLTIDSGSYNSTYAFTAAPPTITSTPSAGTGVETYSSSTTGVCTVNASTGAVTFVSAGTCTIGAHIATDGTYAAADATAISFTVTLGSRTLQIDEDSYIGTYALAATPPTITSTPSAGSGTKTYSSSTTGVCTVGASTGAVTFVSAGTCTIGATIATDGTYAAADATAISFSVGLVSRTLTINASSFSSSYDITATPPTITSTASAGSGTKKYTSLTTGVCTVDEATGAVTFVSAGTCTIDASIAADGTYGIATADSISFSVAYLARTLEINDASYGSSYTVIATPPTITSTPSAGSGTKTYSSSTTGVCTVNASTGAVSFTGTTGTCTIGASIATDGTYASATATSVSFNVTLATRTLAIDADSYLASYTVLATAPTITSTPSAGAGVKTYSSSTTGVCTVGASTGAVTFVSAGTCTIGASIATDGTYTAADAATVSFAVTLVARTITVDSASYHSTYETTDAPPTLTATLSAGTGAKEWTSLTPSVCTVDASTGAVTFLGKGVCRIKVDVAANATHGAASDEISFRIGNTSNGGGSSAPKTPFTYDFSLPACTSSRAVSIGITGTNLGRVRFSSDSDFTTATWQTISYHSVGLYDDATWTLPEGDGVKHIYAQFASPSEEWSDGHLHHEIKLDMSGRCQEATTTSGNPTTGGSTGGSQGGTSVQTTTGTTEPSQSNTGTKNEAPKESSVTPAPMSYKVYIVNPDGTQRRVGSNYVRETVMNNGVVVFGFEDSGSDFDYNDVVVSVDQRDPAKVVFSKLPLSARWHHSIHVESYQDGQMVGDRVLWADSHDDQADELKLSNDQLVPTETPAATCTTAGKVNLGLFIINPNGTRRMTGTRYVKVTNLSAGISRYAFEDKGDDFDLNDVIIDVDSRNLAKVTFTAMPMEARWHHKIGVTITVDGVAKPDVIIWEDSHLAEQRPVTLDLLKLLSLCQAEMTAAETTTNQVCRAAAPFTKQMTWGSTDAEVRSLQQLLQCRGEYPKSAPLTGYFGEMTAAAVRAFRQANGLVPMEIVGPLMRAKLNAL